MMIQMQEVSEKQRRISQSAMKLSFRGCGRLQIEITELGMFLVWGTMHTADFSK